MIVARYAVSDPGKAGERSRLLEEHKAYLHGAAIRILLSDLLRRRQRARVRPPS